MSLDLSEFLRQCMFRKNLLSRYVTENLKWMIGTSTKRLSALGRRILDLNSIPYRSFMLSRTQVIKWWGCFGQKLTHSGKRLLSKPFRWIKSIGAGEKQ